jgi:hypothetical protein
MDGSPSRGETIPIRLFLGGFDLTPTFREVNKKYSTRYYLSLVLIDEGTLLQSLPPFDMSNNVQMHDATSSNPKSSFTVKHQKLPLVRGSKLRSQVHHHQRERRFRRQRKRYEWKE